MRVGVLGTVEAHADAGALATGGPRQRAVLGVLALARPAVVPVEQLADAVWAGAPPRTAEHTLHNYVLRLRRLGIAIERVGDGYRLDSPTDADELQAAAEALRVAPSRKTVRRLGDALDAVRGTPGHDIPDSDLSRAPKAALVERVESAREDLAAAALELAGSRGASSRQVAELRELVTAAPYRERRWELLILGLYRAGRQSDALEAYGEARELFARELGIDPGPELVRLQQRVLSQDPALLGGPAGAAVHLGGRALPGLATRLVGRSGDRAALDAALEASRLVSVVGPLGAGKTRLVLELAQAWPGPVWFVPLEDLAAPTTTVPQAVAGVVAPDSRAADPVDAVIAVVRDTGGLLVLDGAEHAVDAIADLVGRLLAGTSDLRLLVSSRQRLRVRDEAVVAIDSLTPEDSRELLVDRARLGSPTFTLAAGDEAVADRLCALVDGLPLGIELVARHLRLLSMHDLVDRVDADLERWTTTDETSPGLVSAVAASVEGLQPAQRDLLIAMTVFPAEVDLALTQEVAAPDADQDEVFDAVAALVDHSLLQVRSGSAGIRYALLLSVRRHLLERLPAQRRRVLEATYVKAVLHRAERYATAVSSSDRAEAIAVLDADLPHLRQALTTAVDGDAASLALRAATALGPYWLARRPSEGMAWLARLIAAGDVTGTDRARVLLQMGHLAYWLTDFERGERLLTEARELLPRGRGGAAAEPVLLGRVLRRLGAIAAARDDVSAARVWLEESLAVLEQSDATVEAAISKLHLGSLLADECQTEAALPLLVQARAELRAADDALQESHALSALSLVWWKSGDVTAALGAGEQAVARFAALGHRPSEGVVAYRLSAICRVLDRPDDARRYAELALTVGNETGTRTTSALALVATARLDLDTGDLAAATADLTAALELVDTSADRWVLAETVEVVGRLLIERGEPGSRAIEVAAVLRAQIGQPAPPTEAAELADLSARSPRASRMVGPDSADAEAVRGWALDLCWATPATTTAPGTARRRR